MARNTERVEGRLADLLRAVESVRLVIGEVRDGTPPGRECARCITESAYALAMELVAIDAVMIHRKMTRPEISSMEEDARDTSCDELRALRNVAHAAWHLLDNTEEGDNTCEHDSADNARLSEALDDAERSGWAHG